MKKRDLSQGSKIVALAVILLPIADLAKAQAPAKQPTFEVMEIRLEQLERRIRQLQKQEDELTAAVLEREQKIADLKKAGDLNYLQQTRLQRLLKEAHQLAGEIEGMDRQLEQVNQSYSQTGDRLSTLYSTRINNLLKRLESKKVTGVQRQTLLKQVERLRIRNQALRQKLGLQDSPDVNAGELQISPTDTPRQIEQKADVLKDQEDKYRSLSQQLGTRYQELERELQLRNRIDDLVADLSLFDQQEEAIGSLAPETGQGMESVDGPGDSDFSANIGSRESRAEVIIGQGNFDYTGLSDGNLEEVVALLKQRQIRAVAQADSLKKRAEFFLEAARDLRKR